MPFSISLLSIGNAIRALFMLLLTKLVSSLFGTSGLIALGSFQNILGILGPVSSLGANSAVALFFSKDSCDLKSVRTTLVVLLFLGFVLGVFLLMIMWPYFVDTMAAGYSLNLLILVIYCFASSLLALVSGYMQGRSLILSLATGTIIAGVVNIVILSIAYFGWGLADIVNLAAAQVILSAFVLCLIVRKDLLSWSINLKTFQADMIRPLLQMGAFSLSSGIILSLGFIDIREQLIDISGVLATGNWEAATRIFPMISILICTPIFTRYFSILCNLKNYREVLIIYKEISKIAMSVFILGIFMIYCFSDIIVSLLFSSEFSMYAEFAVVFVFGDCCRSYAAMLNYYNLASENYITHFIGEIVFISALVALINFVNPISFQSLAYYYLGASFLCLAVVSVTFSLQLRRVRSI
jgi:O-antigen/teichoic acid export membrane protein